MRTIMHFRPAAYTSWHALVPFDHSGTTTGAFLLGALLWIPGNWMFKRNAAIARTIKQWNDYLEIRLNKALEETRQVAVTLKNGKTYVGFVTRAFDPSFDRKYIVILPTKSGYRDKETHELYFTTDYTSVYLQLIDDDNSRLLTRPEEFEIVIPVGEIASANLFDFDAYELFNSPKTSADTADIVVGAQSPQALESPPGSELPARNTNQQRES